MELQSLPVPANEPTPAERVDNLRLKITGLNLFGCKPITPQSNQQCTLCLVYT